MNKQFQVLSSSEVVSVEESDQIVVSHTTFKVGEFLELLRQNHLYSDEAEEWLGKGVSCEILSPSKGWRKGRVKISLVFCLDETESPLDDIRQAISELE